MHHLIVFVVKAEDKEEALSEANKELDDIIEKGGAPYIDYGSFFSEDGVNGHSVKNWGAKKAAATLEDEEGRQWLMRNLLIDFQEFKDNIERVKEILAHKTPNEIYKDNMDSYRFRKVDHHQWVVCDGEFMNFYDIRSWLDDKDAKDVWIVPCDVHT